RCPKCGGSLKGCEDVFDTWMDSSITPLFNTFWGRDENLFKELYPMSLRPQAHDIIRTWAFYTILRCYLLTNEKPFEEIMIDGFILAPDGKPMHTSLGNVVDPLEVIERNGSDALRYYASTCKLGEDNSFRPKDVIRGIRLMNKLWNVENFIGNLIKIKPKKCKLRIVDRWILTVYSRVIKKATEYMDKFEFSNAMKEIEYFLWHEFADHYIEMVKHRIYEEKDEASLYTLYVIGLGLLKTFSPFLPFITEEIYDKFYKKFDGKESVHISEWPEPILIDEEAETEGEIVKEVISEIREWKSKNGISLNSPLSKVIIYGNVKENDIISGTLKIKEIIFEDKSNIDKRAFPVYSKIGPYFKEKSKVVLEEINKNGNKIAKDIEEKGFYSFNFKGEEIKIEKEFLDIKEETKENLLKAKDIFILVEK
ncbi:MAG: class I tRNA ligase family protein, partial [Candidatus Thermoplasmatota archaeon]